jgi:hypothetical protein
MISKQLWSRCSYRSSNLAFGDIRAADKTGTANTDSIAGQPIFLSVVPMVLPIPSCLFNTERSEYRTSGFAKNAGRI